jgi:hypothetical protein
MIKALYNLTETCVSVNGHLTDWFKTIFGVRQGDCLSPTLFSLFVNDLAIGLKSLDLGVKIGTTSIPILLYADDIAVISECENDMKRMLNYVTEWCEEWQMKINMSKSKILHYRKKGVKRSSVEFKLAGSNFDYVQDYKYLGVILDEHLEFKSHEETLAGSGSRALGAVIAKLKKLGNMGYDTYTKCYESSVCPVLDYGAEVWGYVKAQKVENVHTKAMKVFLGVHRFAANVAVIGDMGWTPANVRRKLHMLRYYNRLVNLSNERLTKKFFRGD